MNKKIYCVIEGGDFPEGAPYGVFETIDEAVNFIQNDVEAGYWEGWNRSTYIYCYSLGEKGYEKILNHLGVEIK